MINFNSLMRSFGYALEGVFHTIRNNQNMKIHIIVAILVVIVGLVFRITLFEMLILGIMILLVLVTEMINTAIEEAVDLIVTIHHKQAKIVKDVAAGMVLVAAIGAVIVGIIIFTPYIF